MCVHQWLIFSLTYYDKTLKSHSEKVIILRLSIYTHAVKRTIIWEFLWHMKLSTLPLLTQVAYYAEQGLCNGRASVRPSVCPIDRQQQRWPEGLLQSALRAEDVDRQLPPPAPRTSCRCAQLQWRRSRRRRSAANASSVMLTADWQGWTQTCLILLDWAITYQQNTLFVCEFRKLLCCPLTMLRWTEFELQPQR